MTFLLLLLAIPTVVIAVWVAMVVVAQLILFVDRIVNPGDHK